MNLSYDNADHGLILALAERWQFETNTFHLTVGEMTITLDNVNNLLHLRIIGQFCEFKPLKFEKT